MIMEEKLLTCEILEEKSAPIPVTKTMLGDPVLFSQQLPCKPTVSGWARGWTGWATS